MSWSVIIGNGFSIDAYSYASLPFNPSFPWSWPLKSPYESDEPLINLFPELKKFLETYSDYRKLNIFESLEPIVKETRNKPINQVGTEASFEDNVHIEACHYLRLAYSWYTTHFSDEVLKSWHWTKWFNENGHSIDTVLSYNYDLILENTLSLADLGKVYGHSTIVPYVDVLMKGTQPEPYWDEMPGDKNVIHVAKPHGSCNFTGWGIIQRSDDGRVKPIYPQDGAYLFRDDSMLKILEKQDLYQPTYSADLVLPGEWSWWNEVATTKLEWVKFQKKVFIEESANSNNLLIIGFGCSEPDKEEFSNMAYGLNNFEKVYVIDPNPKDNLLEIISRHTETIITLNAKDFLNGH